MKTASIAQMTIRGAGVLQLILGFIVWSGKTDFLVPVHILIGSILVVALLALCTLAWRSGVSKGLVILTLLWALILPVWGIFQPVLENHLSESLAWIIAVSHLLCGVGAIGLSEMMGGMMKKKIASPA